MRAIAVAAAACGFAAVSVLARLAYEAGSEPDSLLASRFVVAGLLLAPWAFLRDGGRIDPRRLAEATAAGAALAGGGFLEFEALARLTAPAVVTLVFLTPVWVAVASWLRGEPPPPRIGVVVFVLPAALVVFLGVPAGEPLDAAGATLAVGASLVYALVFVLLERLVRRQSPARAIAWVMGAAAATCAAITPEGVAEELTGKATAPCALGVGTLTAASFLALGSGMRELGALPASLIAAAEPVAAAVISAVVLEEVLTPVQVAGGVALLASITVASTGGETVG
jgi:drug/metabolite transporter (DMT)-like permease